MRPQPMQRRHRRRESGEARGAGLVRSRLLRQQGRHPLELRPALVREAGDVRESANDVKGRVWSKEHMGGRRHSETFPLSDDSDATHQSFQDWRLGVHSHSGWQGIVHATVEKTLVSLVTKGPLGTTSRHPYATPDSSPPRAGRGRRTLISSYRFSPTIQRGVSQGRAHTKAAQTAHRCDCSVVSRS